MTTQHAPLPESLDEAGLAAVAAEVAASAGPGDFIALHGDLGAGKTTFARAFIRARPGGGDIGEVPSPTFTLVQVYELPKVTIWHFDLYRLDTAEEIWELGFEEALAGGISLIEWPERMGPLLPRRRTDISLTFADAPDRRHIAIAHADG